MGGTVFPSCSLVWGSPVLESAVSMVGYRLYGRGNGNLFQEDLCFWTVVLEDSWEFFGWEGGQTSVNPKGN